ncbi:MAG: NAD(P)/FAD-dependent oxidoreductase [Candidatus Saganbacteria bacterium]|nr:NAD(P)/FAD-dependent oxidoreductase [Candidatus Saganbacteria bacterium]
MKKSSQIVIVGAGPIGSYTGKLLQSYGFDPLLIEEHPEVGKPVQCAGIVGRDVFERTQLPLSRKSILNTIEGANVSFNGAKFKMKRPGVAQIISREVFDKELAEGLRVRLNTRFTGLSKSKDKYLVQTNKGDFEADVVIGADGPNSKVRKEGKFDSNLKLYKGLQYRIKLEVPDKKMVDVRYIKPFSLFNWMIPEGNGVVRVGTLSLKPLEELEKYIKESGFEGLIVEKNAGLVPIGMTQLVKEHLALVGDAACQVKPMTSGGIFYGLKSAEILARAINDGKLHQYETEWKKAFDLEIKISFLIRYVMESLSDDLLHSLFQVFGESIDHIEKEADFENHSSTMKAILVNPRFYPLFVRALFQVLSNPRLIMRLLVKK